MSLIDDIEFLGESVDAGLIDLDSAAELLAERSQGGLTVLGARDSLRSHRGMRARLEGVMARAARGLQVLRAVQDARTPEEFAAADAARVAWSDQERARMCDDARAHLRRPVRRDPIDITNDAQKEL